MMWFTVILLVLAALCFSGTALHVELLPDQPMWGMMLLALGACSGFVALWHKLT